MRTTKSEIYNRGEVARNSLWNLGGFVLPGLAALFALPRLIAGYGSDRFGLLGIFWIAVGYFGLFDFGLGRALTRMVAFYTDHDENHRVPSLVWTGLWMMLAFGIATGTVVFLGAHWASEHLLKIPVELRGEATLAGRLLGICIPAVTVAAGGRGVLEARQRFAAVSMVRMSLGVVMYAGPLAVLPFSRTIVGAAGVLVVARYATMTAQLVLCLRTIPELRASFRPRREALSPLLRFGGWMTISNLISPIMATLDRFLLGVVLSTAAVALYTAPQEVVTKLNVLPGAMVVSIFPIFSRSFAKHPNEVTRLYNRALEASILSLAPVVLCLAYFADPLLRLWLRASYNPISADVLRILAIGVMINGAAQTPYALVQGAGRPDLTAKIHLTELPIFCVLFVVLVHANGVAGAAEAWSIRVFLDLIALSAAALACDRRFRVERRVIVEFAFVLVAALLGALIKPLPLRGVMFIAALVPTCMRAIKMAGSLPIFSRARTT